MNQTSQWIKEHPDYLIDEWERVLRAFDKEVRKDLFSLVYKYVDGSVIFVLTSDDYCYKIEDREQGFWHISLCDRPGSVMTIKKWAIPPQQRNPQKHPPTQGGETGANIQGL